MNASRTNLNIAKWALNEIPHRSTNHILRYLLKNTHLRLLPIPSNNMSDDEFDPGSSPLAYKSKALWNRRSSSPGDSLPGFADSEGGESGSVSAGSGVEGYGEGLSEEGEKLEVIGTVREEGDGLPVDAEYIPLGTQLVDGKRKRWCPDCKIWIGLGRSTGSNYTYEKHRQSNKCKKRVRKLNSASSHKKREAAAKSTVGLRIIARGMLSASSSLSSLGGSSADMSSGELGVSNPYQNESLANQSSQTSAYVGPLFSCKCILKLNFNSAVYHSDSTPTVNVAAEMRGGPGLTRDWAGFRRSNMTWKSSLREGLVEGIMEPEVATTEPTVDCPGVVVEWPIPGSMWRTYPFALHSNDGLLGYSAISFNASASTITVRSDACTTKSTSGSCLPCRLVESSKNFKSVKEHALYTAKHTPYLFKSHDQLTETIEYMGKEMKQLRTKVGDTLLGSNTASLMRRHVRSSTTPAVLRLMLIASTTIYKRFAMAVGTLDVPRLKQLVNQGLKHGASASALIAKMQASAAGLYRARGYDTQDAELAYVAKALSGTRLLFALNHSLVGLPSARTIRRHMKVPELLPSIREPTRNDFGTNITSFCGPLTRPNPPTRAGHSILVDAIATETKACYDRCSDCILGLCREHSRALDLHVHSLETVKHIAQAIHGDNATVHYASEATVLAIAPFTEDHYTAVPLAISPSCKAETADDLAGWLTDALIEWHTNPDGEARNGPCWSIESDGDQKYRTAKWRLLTQQLEEGSELHSILSRLHGLDLRVGLYDITIGADPKHIDKRTPCFINNLNHVY